jgi:hypothetical protein
MPLFQHFDRRVRIANGAEVTHIEDVLLGFFEELASWLGIVRVRAENVAESMAHL